MKALLKFIVTSIGLVLILIGLGVILIGTRFDSGLKRGIERGLGYVYDTEVTVDEVSVVWSKEAIEIGGLTIYNPKEFKKGEAMRFASILVQLDLPTVFSETPTIKEISVVDARINLRHEAGVGTNLGKLDENASRLRGKPLASDAPKSAKHAYIVRRLKCDGAMLALSSNVLPISSLELAIEPFEMTDLGSDSPVSTADLCVLFMRNVLKEGISVKGILKPMADVISKELQRFRGETPAPEPQSDVPESTPSGT
ncbi:MAG: hypothetical protein K1Y02_05665 [Candidatus Hydrogenedentes bacterium]|nr:hypothetical protein [Candidatus Hydrogenedentota bacterium]